MELPLGYVHRLKMIQALPAMWAGLHMFVPMYCM
jgi:hypothetical protein